MLENCDKQFKNVLLLKITKHTDQIKNKPQDLR